MIGKALPCVKREAKPPAFCIVFGAFGIESPLGYLGLGECKWFTRPAGRGILQELVNKTAEFAPEGGQWQVAYLGFARDGWTEEAQAYAHDLKSIGTPKQGNWQLMTMKLLDLNQVDADLRDWVRR